MKVKYLERNGELFVYNPLLAARKGFKEVEVEVEVEGSVAEAEVEGPVAEAEVEGPVAEAEVEDSVVEAPAKKPKQKPAE